jgi:SulP family sulfate permease
MPDGSATTHLYRPKLLTILNEGYSVDHFRKDLLAALTVAIVALPLSMAFGVASGVSPARGLSTAIVGGFLVSALGGSRFQIGGPAGAFIVLVAATVTRFGVEGLLLTVLLSGLTLTLVGLSRLGSLIRHIPHAVTVGFTAGIAVTILASQLKDFGGLKLAVAEPGMFIPKIIVLANAFSTISPTALAIGVGSATVIFLQRRVFPTWPGMLIAVVLASVTAFLLKFPVETIGSRFGELPHGLPVPQLPPITANLVLQVLPSALSFTLLGGVESLLSAKVADSMTGRKHRSNMELVAQGIANIASALFGGARSPVSGIMHSIFLLLFMLIAAPLASFVPLAALAGVLVVVCWNMADKEEFWRLAQDWPSAAVLGTTFGLTLLRDLTTGIIAGCVLAAVLTLFKRKVSEEGA